MSRTPPRRRSSGTQQLPGDLQDSRIVGHILYVVGIDASGADTLVASYDVSNPQSFAKVAEVDFPFGDWDIGVFLNVTDTRIIVAQTGDTCDLVHDTGKLHRRAGHPVRPHRHHRSQRRAHPRDVLPRQRRRLGSLGHGLRPGRAGSSARSCRAIGTETPAAACSPSGPRPTTTSAPTQLGSLAFTAGDHVTATAFAGPRVYVSSNTSSSGCPDPVVVLDTTKPGARPSSSAPSPCRA